MTGGAPIHDDDLVELARALAGLRHELATAGVVVPSEVDVDPAQRFGPWQAVLDAVRSGVATMGDADAGTLLERSLPAATALRAVLPAAEAAAAASGRGPAVDEAVVAAIEDAAVLAGRVAGDDPGFALAVESSYAGTLAAAYATWVVRDLLDPATARTGTALVDGILLPLDALRRLTAHGVAAAVLDVAEALPGTRWAALAACARSRDDEVAKASVRLRAAAALAGLGGAEVAVVARLAPADLDPSVAGDAALVIGDAAVAAAAGAAGAADEATCEVVAAAWRAGSHPG